MFFHRFADAIRLLLLAPIPMARDIAPMVEQAKRQADDIAGRLNALAATPNPYTGKPDAFGALVHSMRGTQQTRQEDS